ncbi:MAG: hypothetical protein EOO32_03960 [Comamonadaceae bacterium]|nr:MAG: hypothetical protein EOO32_03960 [Comamonadaceae bacterium]
MAYTYNLLGQRILKSDARITGYVGTPTTQQTVYADDGIGSTVLGQYRNKRSTTSAAPAGEMDSTEVIYLPTASGPMPIATEIDGRLYAIASDHLNTPRRLTNQQGQVAWQWLITGFGEVAPTKGNWGYMHSNSSRNYSEAINFDLRYPGQQWDEETGLAYNLHRYYDAATGRYMQADPIGLEGGWNRFGYVGGNPLNAIDPLGLYESSPWLRALVPGQVSFDRGMTALENGNYGAAAISFGTMLGEQVLTVGSLGLGRVAGPAGGICDTATKGATPLLQAPRQIEAAWGVSTYRHGGLMSGIEHVMYRHGPRSGFSSVSRFAEGTRMRDISGFVDSALRSGAVMSTGRGAYTVEYNLGRTIGTDVAGNATSNIRVHVRDGVIQTAFPF